MACGSHDNHRHAQAALAARSGIGRAFAMATALNVAFVLVEAVFGVLSGSTALIADALHNFGDVLGLVLAWSAAALASRGSLPGHTYGLGRVTILAALINALFLYGVVGALGWEAVRRLLQPTHVNGPMVMAVAAIIALRCASARSC